MSFAANGSTESRPTKEKVARAGGRAGLCRAKPWKARYFLFTRLRCSKVLSVESEAARLRPRGAVFIETTMPSLVRVIVKPVPVLPKLVFKLELQSVAGNLRVAPSAFRRSAVTIGVGPIECDLHAAAGLFDA